MAAIHIRADSTLFGEDVEAIINAVNCVGVMGNGELVALLGPVCEREF